MSKSPLTPRQRRILHALLTRSRTREQIDSEAGASNGPDEIHRLRAKGLAIPCTRISCFDNDGKEVRRGIYHLTVGDHRKLPSMLKDALRQ